MHLPPESELVRDLQARLPAAFSHFYKSYSQALLSELLRIVKDPLLAEDLLHDVYLKVWSNIHQYKPEQGRLYTWLKTVTHHVAYDAMRKQKTQQDLNGIVAYQQDTDVHLPVFEILYIEFIMDQLTPVCREVIELTYFNGYTHQETADYLEIPLGTVKNRIRNGLLQLKDYFRRDIDVYKAGEE